MDKKARFWDKQAVRYSKAPVRNPAVYEKKLEISRKYFRPEMEVLEFGCGTGSTAIAHAPFVKHVLATDISSKMLEIAQGKADAAKLTNVSFKVSAIEELNEEAQKFDAVLGLSILHLLENPAAAITKANQLLKPGGVFITSTACLGDIKAFWKPLLPVGRFLGLLPLVNFFKQEWLEQTIRDAGFQIDSTYRESNKDAVFIVAKKIA